MKNRKYLVIGTTAIVLMGLLLFVSTRSSAKINGKEVAESSPPSVALSSSVAVEKGAESSFLVSLSSDVKKEVVIDFPENAIYKGVEGTDDLDISIVYDEATHQLRMNNTSDQILDEEGEVYHKEFEVKFVSQKVGSYTFEASTEDKSVQKENLDILVKSSEPADSKAQDARSTRAVASVTTWAEFTAAMSDNSVSEITLANDISFGSPTLGTYTRSITINGGGHELNIGTEQLTLGSVASESTLKLTNLVLSGSGSNARVSATAANSANWVLSLSDVSFGASIGTQTIFELERGKLLIDGGLNTFNNGLDSTATTRGMMTAKKIHVTNGAIVNASLKGGFIYSDEADTETRIDSGSQLTVHSETGLLINQHARSVLIVEGQGSFLKGTGNRYDYGNYGTLVSLVGDNSLIDIDNGAVVDIAATGTPAMLLNSANGVFSVRNKSTLKLVSSGGYNDAAATLRFRVNGGQTFDVQTDSLIDIRKIQGGTASTAAKSAPALRMRNPNNIVKVSTGGKVNIYNEGDGTPADPGSDNRNQGILYDSGNDNKFELTDKNSIVTIDADNGAAIDSQNRTAEISAGPGTIFVARGKTETSNGGIFNTSVSKITVNNPLFFDFRNDRPGGGNVFNVSTGSTLSSIQSYLSVWKKGDNLDGDPMHNWPLFDYSLSGANFTKVDSSTDSTFTTLYGEGGNGATAYSRMSGNNAAPKVNELRQATNADQSAFGHVSVPVGGEGDRDAWTDEAYVKVKITDKTGGEKSVVVPTIGMNNASPGLEIYGEAPRAGMFKADNVNGSNVAQFLKTGDSVEVVKAWRGLADENSNRNIFSDPSDITTSVMTTQDVTPPSSLATKLTDVTTATKQLTGTIDLYDQRDEEVMSEVKLFVKVNGQFLKDDQNLLVSKTVTTGDQPSGSTVKEWTIDLPRYVTLAEGSVEVYAKDTTVLPVNSGGQTEVVNPPNTYTTEPDSVSGNLSTEVKTYTSYTGYHDAVKDNRFKPSIALQIKDVVPSKPLVTKTVKSDTVSNGSQVTQVGSILSYTVQVKNDDQVNSGKVWYNAIFSDVIPAGLDFKLATGKVKLTVNGVSIAAHDASYDESSRALKMKLGDFAPQDEAIIEFEGVVNRDAVDTEIENTAWGIGESPQETPFVSGPLNPNADHLVIENSDRVKNPGGMIGGQLVLESVPANINFGVVDIKDFQKKVGADARNIDLPLSVIDTRKVAEKWDITAEIIQEMTNGPDVYAGALKYVYKNMEFTLNSQARTIYENETPNANGLYNISDTWSKAETADGIKLRLDSTKAPKTTGVYEGVIKWSLRDTIP